MHHVTYSGNLAIVKILELHHIRKNTSLFLGQEDGSLLANEALCVSE
jgi:hypothetical protein